MSEELSRVKDDLANLLSAAHLATLILDADLRVRLCSPLARGLFLLGTELDSQPFYALPASHTFPGLTERIHDVLHNVSGQEYESASASGRWHRIHIRPYRCDDTRIRGVVVCAMDIHELKQHVREASDARALAESGNRVRDQFLNMLSHELRTPLSSILIHAQMLRLDELEPTKRARSLNMIEQSARAQTQLVDDLLDATRIVAGTFGTERQAFELCPIVLNAIESFREQIRARELALEVRVDRDIEQVWSDPTRVAQVVRNLMANAVKFTPPGGQVLVSLNIDDGNAVLQVSDTGVGIDAAFLPHVFDRLVQQEGELTRRYGGLGLGLAIVRHIVEGLGGRVTAHSPGVGRGSTFKVTFPLTGFGPSAALPTEILVTAPRPLDRPGRMREYEHLRGLRVLVLEDDPGTLQAVLEVFRLSGSMVKSATCVADALVAFETFSPQVMVCDIAMPERDGYDFIRQLRERAPERGGNTPAVALTALSSPEDRRRAIAAGYQMHMAKPVDIDRLRDVVTQLMDQSAAG